MADTMTLPTNEELDKWVSSDRPADRSARPRDLRLYRGRMLAQIGAKRFALGAGFREELRIPADREFWIDCTSPDVDYEVVSVEPTLNEALEALGYITEPGPTPGVKLVLTKRRRSEVFRGRAGEVWAWLRKCPVCEFRGYTDVDCECSGTGKRVSS